MLIFFIHGVATRDAKYASVLQENLKKKFLDFDQKLPLFYSSFWGHALNDISKIWNWIAEDLRDLRKQSSSTETDQSFRYQNFREGFISEFVGDMFTYLNPKRGVEIRKILADQLSDFLASHPSENELHIISHSLGTVILWDALFSNRFQGNDPAYKIRALIRGLSDQNSASVNLRSLTTMGSPILFFNAMLEVSPETIKDFFKASGDLELKWLNVIHASDLVAYPLRASLNINEEKIDFQDIFISTDANFAETAARSIGQNEAAMALSAAHAHVGYWNCPETLNSIIANLLSLKKESVLDRVIQALKKVPGMTPDQLRLHLRDAPVNRLDFLDESGYLNYVVNAANIHHVYVFDREGNCQYSGYVGWIHTNALKEAVHQILNQQSQWLT